MSNFIATVLGNTILAVIIGESSLHFGVRRCLMVGVGSVFYNLGSDWKLFQPWGTTILRHSYETGSSFYPSSDEGRTSFMISRLRESRGDCWTM